jgi:hypothetical protein
MGYDHETDDGEMDALEVRLRRRLRIDSAAGGFRKEFAAGERGRRTPAR